MINLIAAITNSGKNEQREAFELAQETAEAILVAIQALSQQGVADFTVDLIAEKVYKMHPDKRDVYDVSPHMVRLALLSIGITQGEES